jgi:hypothetical protein
VLLKYSSTLIVRENILATVGITFDNFDDLAFDTMANAVDGDYQEQSVLANFDSEEFWASASLKNWLSACDETLCHGVWHTAHRMSSSERVQVMHLALSILPCVSSSLSFIRFDNSTSILHRTWLPTYIHLCGGGDRTAMNFGTFSSPLTLALFSSPFVLADSRILGDLLHLSRTT